MFDFESAKALYLASLRSDDMSANTLDTYDRILGHYATFCNAHSIACDSPASVSMYKSALSDKGNKLVTISMHLNIVRLFFAYSIRMKLHDGDNPVLDELMPPRKKVRAERKPYDHLMGENDLARLFSGIKPKGGQERHFLRNRAIILTLLGCGLRNTELRSLAPCDLLFGGEESSKITVRSGKGDKYRIVPFPTVVQQAVKAYLDGNVRPAGLPDDAPLFGVGTTRDDWHMMGRDALSDMCMRYIKSAAGFDNARSHACRHAFASFNLTHGVPMAEIQSMLGHSSIMTTEHYASLLRPTAPTSSGNKVFNDAFAQTSMV